jgi:hypothetical protein
MQMDGQRARKTELPITRSFEQFVQWRTEHTNILACLIVWGTIRSKFVITKLKRDDEVNCRDSFRKLNTRNSIPARETGIFY